jgi:hypothetical protein
MRVHRIWLLLGLVLAGGCAKRDFGGLCKLATEILTEPRVTPSMRFSRFLDDAPNVAFSGVARALIDNLANVPPQTRYDFVVAAAKEEGLDGWSCPALESVLNPPAETSR